MEMTGARILCESLVREGVEHYLWAAGRRDHPAL